VLSSPPDGRLLRPAPTPWTRRLSAIVRATGIGQTTNREKSNAMTNNNSDEIERPAYGPGHPWHYLPEGDGAAPFPVDAIPAIDADFARKFLTPKLPANPLKRATALDALLRDNRALLAERTGRYQAILEHRTEALSRYDRDIAYQGNDELAFAASVATLYNHIRFYKGLVAWLEDQAGRQFRLFD
jgi:hypothetical protein